MQSTLLLILKMMEIGEIKLLMLSTSQRSHQIRLYLISQAFSKGIHFTRLLQQDEILKLSVFIIYGRVLIKRHLRLDELTLAPQISK